MKKKFRNRDRKIDRASSRLPDWLLHPVVMWLLGVLVIGGIIFIGVLNDEVLNLPMPKILMLVLFCMLLSTYFVTIAISGFAGKDVATILRLVSSFAVTVLICLIFNTSPGVSAIIIIGLTTLGYFGPKWIQYVNF